MCLACGTPLAQDKKPGFKDVCETCGRDLHTCTHCRFYRPGARWDCAESSVQESVPGKETHNYCDWFETNPEFFKQGGGKSSSAAEKARQDLKKLFGD